MLLIGWDAADWKVIHPLLDSGRMPNLEKLVNQGVMANMATLYPHLSPMLWTSIATGKRPFKHGIHGFTEPDPAQGGIRPITNLSRKTKAVWNILSQAGLKCNVIGWWPSHPAEPINGVMVSDHYQKAVGSRDQAWPMRPGVVHPERLIRNLAALRVHPEQLDEGHILPFVPRAAEIDQDNDRRLTPLARTIAECLSVRNAAQAVMHHEPWDFTAVYFDGIDHFCHGFMRYHPPRLSWVEEKDFDIYSEVVESAYILHDIMLGQLLAETDEDATVMLVSDHGFKSDHLRPPSVPREPAGPAVQHRHFGVFVMKGPGVRRDERIDGVGLLDVCPTILQVFGLPVGGDMDGKVLINAFERPPEVAYLPSWDQEPGPAGLHPPDLKMDPLEAREAIQQLAALGYIDTPPDDQEKAAAQAVRELDYNVARSYMDAGRHAEAADILERLLSEWPDEYRFGLQLVFCQQALGRLPEARAVLEELFRRKKMNAAEAQKKLEAWRERHKETEALPEEERRILGDLQAEARSNPYTLEYLMGALLLAEGDRDGALEHLTRAEKIDPSQTGPHLKIGEAYLRLKQWPEAEKEFRTVLASDPDSAAAWRGLAESLLARRLNEEAAEAALEAVALIYHSPEAHYLLGTALHRLGDLPRALEALTVAVRINPNYPEAHRRLAYIYRHRLHDEDRADEHEALARRAVGIIKDLRAGRISLDQFRGMGGGPSESPSDTPGRTGPSDLTPPPPFDSKETITIVSGLPRSGTSLMMQMLAAGGIPPLTDDRRPPDEDNPRGYLEYEPAKGLQRDASWLSQAKGRTVKIVAQLLRFLPPGFDYRVVFMERDLDEVLRSQATMLARQGRSGAKLGPAALRRVFAAQVARIKEMLVMRGIPTLYVSFNESLRQAEESAVRVNGFFGGRLDERAMAGAVDSSLYRQRKPVLHE